MYPFRRVKNVAVSGVRQGLMASEEGRLVAVRAGLVHAQIRARPQIGGRGFLHCETSLPEIRELRLDKTTQIW